MGYVLVHVTVTITMTRLETSVGAVQLGLPFGSGLPQQPSLLLNLFFINLIPLFFSFASYNDVHECRRLRLDGAGRQRHPDTPKHRDG